MNDALNLDNLLDFDAIAEMEKRISKHWQDFSDKENSNLLALTMMNSEVKDIMLRNAGDTHSRMTWTELKRLLIDNGFSVGLVYYFVPYPENQDRIEEAILYYHPLQGFLVWATSFSYKTVVNECKFYAEIQSEDNPPWHVMHDISTGGCIDQDNHIYDTQQDGREGLFHKISKLESHGHFLPIWIKQKHPRHLWFVDYLQDKKPNYDYKAITDTVIARAHPDVAKIINR